MTGELDGEKLRDRIRLACDWLVDIAQLRTNVLPADTVNKLHHVYTSWKGAIRGEYSVADKQWWLFCPVWHTGQAVKALLRAYPFVRDERCLHGAREGAKFILDKQVWDKSSVDHGLILAYEDWPDKVNTSAILESLHGLMMLADFENSDVLWERVVASGEFLLKSLYIPEKKVYHDVYDPAIHRPVLPTPIRTKNEIGGRPLLDDGIMYFLYKRTGEQKFLDVQIGVSDRLLADQNPPGNWLDYGPCHPEKGSFHPRHNYWWGLPLIYTYRATHRQECLQTAIACGRFSQGALREDGGWFRGYFLNGKTNSFGHATSGSACAAILFLELYQETGEADWLVSSEKALSFCQSVQFITPQDINLKGAVLEKVLSPDGSDRSPYYLRDLGTIFFIIGATKYLELMK